jgi:hypothetical protein
MDTRLVITCVVLIGLVGGVVSWSWGQFTRAEKAERAGQIKAHEWSAMQTMSPSPVDEVAAVLAGKVKSLESKLQAQQSELGGAKVDPVRAADTPAQRADAFFAIAQFVEAQRTLAAVAGVTIPEGANFGFSDYANSGPEVELIGVVHRQQMVMQRLLETLWQARPLRLTRTQRETPLLADDAGNRVRRSGRNNDYLDEAGLRKMRREGIVDTLTFRIGFVGKTNTLRRYLRGLTALDLALVVRGIEVEPVSGSGRANGGLRTLADLFRDDEGEPSGAIDGGDAVPIIEANESEFLVTVEYLDFVGGKILMTATDEEGAL